MSSGTQGEAQWCVMEASGLLLDPLSESPVVLLRERGGNLALPIWIGHSEAQAIAVALEGVRETRPRTHDLIIQMLHALACDLLRIEVWALRAGTYFGRLVLCRDGEEVAVDARPSDAIALAVRTRAEIRVDRSVLEQALAPDPEAVGEEERQLREWLEKSRPEMLGRYQM